MSALGDESSHGSRRRLQVMKKAPNQVDRHVGGRVRMRRMMIKMSQEKLGEALGLTFQQVQKYEKGTNRIGASRLQQIGKTLQVPASYFFEGAPGGWEGGEPTHRTSDALVELLGTREGQTLVNCFRRIPDPEVRRSFVALIEGVTGLIDSRPKPKRSRPKPKKK
jgi:transcriptional regulator with XRE-family HTH domain